jgi:RNA polymerase sigma-70 factor (ECF subfamily)
MVQDTSGDIREWLSSARNGSQDALGEALESCRAYLLLVANQELDSGLQAKGGPSDLVQETFLEAQRDFDGFAGCSADELRAWLRKILLHNLANFARQYRDTDKRKLALEVGLPGGDQSGGGEQQLVAELTGPESLALRRERGRQLQAAVERLPDDYRQVIEWRYRDECSFEEIARRLSRSDNAARKLWFRAIEQLKHELGGSL